MKAANFLRVLVGTLITACAISSAEAKKKEKSEGFSEFKGNYTALPAFITFSGQAYSASANFVVSVPKNGNSAVITATGFLNVNGMPYPLYNTFTLTRSTVAIAEALYGLEETGLLASGSGSLNKKGTIFTYSAPIQLAPQYAVSGAISVKPQGKKKKLLTVTLVLSANGQTYSFPFSAIGKASK